MVSTGALAKTVVINYAAKLWTMLAGVVSIWFVARYTSASEQGLYYTINSILALQIFIELGFNYAVVRVIGYKYGQLKEGLVISNVEKIFHHREIAALCARFFRHSIVISLLAVIILAPVGWIYFYWLGETSVTWQLWVSLVVFAGLNIFFNTVLSVIEGLGLTAEIALVRLWQATTLGLCLWLGLMFGAKLQALLWANAASALLVAVLVGTRFRQVFLGAYRARGTTLSSTDRSALRGYMKKIAVSGVAGYLIFQVFTPLITFYSGPVDAGRFAMTLQIITSLNIFGLVPLTSSAPKLGQLIGSGATRDALTLFKRILNASSALMVVVCIGLAAALAIAERHGFAMVDRVLPFGLFGMMLISSIANHVVFSLATYLRSFLDDPFWILSIISALIGAIGAYIGVQRWGYMGAVYVYFINCSLVGLVGAFYIFMKRGNV